MNLSERSTGPPPAGDMPSGSADLDQHAECDPGYSNSPTLGLLFPRLVKGPHPLNSEGCLRAVFRVKGKAAQRTLVREPIARSLSQLHRCRRR